MLPAFVCVALSALFAGPVAAATPVLRVTSPSPYQVFQRGADGLGTVIVDGVCSGLGSRVQARWGGERWRTGKVGAGGRFSLALKREPTGQATLEVRSRQHPEVRKTVTFVGVGDVYVIAGQSNASGRGTLPTRYQDPTLRAGMFGNDDRWKQLRDPVDSAVRQVDKVSRDTYAAGSVWPLVATDLTQADPAPVAFVPCAKGTTSIFRWLRDSGKPYSRTTLYGSMVRRARAAGGVRAVLFWQGEADARAGVSRAEYQAALSELGAEVRQDLGVPFVAAQIGDYDQRYTAGAINDIRLAQEQAWGEGDVAPGPVLYDIDLHGRVHFTQPSQLELAARRWTAAILAGVQQRDVPGGPRLDGAYYDGWTTVQLEFSVPGGELRPGAVGGITVQTSAGDPVAFQYAACTGPFTVSVYLLTPAPEPLTVSLGSGRDSAGQLVPAEDSAWSLPALPFVGVPAEVGDGLLAGQARGHLR